MAIPVYSDVDIFGKLFAESIETDNIYSTNIESENIESETLDIGQANIQTEEYTDYTANDEEDKVSCEGKHTCTKLTIGNMCFAYTKLDIDAEVYSGNDESSISSIECYGLYITPYVDKNGYGMVQIQNNSEHTIYQLQINTTAIGTYTNNDIISQTYTETIEELPPGKSDTLVILVPHEPDDPDDTGTESNVPVDVIQQLEISMTSESYTFLPKSGKNDVELSCCSLKAPTVTANTFTTLSDKKLKTNITPYVCNKSILELPIYEFDYVNNNIHTIGCLAQDLQEICPQIVTQDKNEYLTIQESKIVYLLIDEIKKMREELNELKSK